MIIWHGLKPSFASLLHFHLLLKSSHFTQGEEVYDADIEPIFVGWGFQWLFRGHYEWETWFWFRLHVMDVATGPWFCPFWSSLMFSCSCALTGMFVFVFYTYVCICVLLFLTSLVFFCVVLLNVFIKHFLRICGESFWYIVFSQKKNKIWQGLKSGLGSAWT